MKALVTAVGLPLVLGLVGCGSAETGSTKPSVIPDVVGVQLDVAIDTIEAGGFAEAVER